ncbi:MAG: LmbE family protein [Rhodocyclales bacterium]|nr:LmbE family protein [Rhodocyclales bacterium]
MSRAIHDFVARIPNALVISPHLDDGVFSCGAFMAAHPGCTLLTVFAGPPADLRVQTGWDRACGFPDAFSALAARRMEDEQAARVSNARCRWLDFVDDQYGEDKDERSLLSAIDECVQGAGHSVVLVPFGLFHSDHVRVAKACIALLLDDRLGPCIAYEDALYRRQAGVAQARLGQFAADAIVATPVTPVIRPDDYAKKRAAVACYASQLSAFGRGGHDDLFLPERYWFLQREQDIHEETAANAK